MKNDAPFIRLPLKVGRVEDHLSAVERALADYLAELGPESIRRVAMEALSIRLFRAELAAIVRDEV
jgi:hypothetical protein